MLSIDDIIARKLSLGDLARDAFGLAGNYDYAKPQHWLDMVALAAKELTYSEIAATVVWFYPESTESAVFWLSGLPGVLCEETAAELDAQGIAYWTERGYHGQPIKSEFDANRALRKTCDAFGEIADDDDSACDPYNHTGGRL